MDKRNKQKRRLYTLRNQKKLIRNKKSRKGLRMRCYQCTREYDQGIVPSYLKVMNHLDSNEFAVKDRSGVPNKVACITIPEEFSISEKPDETIYFLRKLYGIAKNNKIRKIIFDHSNCRKLGLSASTIMDIIMCASMKYKESRHIDVEYEGNMPKNPIVREIFLASGLPYHLKAEYRMHYDEDNIERFELVSGECGASTKITGRVSTSMTNYFNKCLRKQGLELNDDGKSILSSILGEVINNCEIHGGTQSTWYTQGHYQSMGKDSYGEMQLLFLNLGNTIYEGLKYASSEETKKRLMHILKQQKSYMSSEWNEEMVGTVFALQQGISRLRDQQVDGYQARGTGTVRLIEQMQAIGESDTGLKPKMTVISGNTYIDFEETYKMHGVQFENDPVFGDGVKKILAFNRKNDIYKPADPERVKKLRERFPGTVISLRFYLDSRYIRKKGGI